MARIYHNPKAKGSGTGKAFKAEISFTYQGIRKRKSKTFDTKREAKKWIADLELNKSNGTNYFKANMKFVDWYWLWFLTYKEKLVAPATKATYRATYKHMKKLIPRVTVEGLNRPIIQGYVNALNRSHETIRKDLTHIRTALRDAVADGVIPRNPADGEVKIVADESLTKSDQRKFMPEADYRQIRDWLLSRSLTIQHTNWFLLMVISQSALRVGEAIALREDDFDFERNTIRVDESYDSIRQQLRSPKTKNANRVVPVPEVLMKRVRIWILEHRSALYRKGIDNPNGYIMFNGHAKFPKASSINKSYHHLQKKLGIVGGYSTHTLRHTLASLLITDNAVSVAYVSKYLGHSSELITRKYYLGLIPEQIAVEQAKVVKVIMNA
ncbi:tyrosine-type recombinase/integrase [Loigolactobacillus coryniformis]|nr:tyrosine-type recombinase/integrase [Loigolactobacillus coryniformis]ATO56136.1 hypothetical protein LC20001_11125 [Loigolactobacillus coryniformis subsp. coryniformis KCTC 3167 = DSM 20001]MCL5458939.1 site-specific integrase [Loigolactobacillus coryniformis]